jgi:exonuclease SbcC
LNSILEELRLANFAGYRNVELKFFSGLNLIRGRNSTGKTTLLDGLAFALFGEALDVKPRLLVSRLPGSKIMETYAKFRRLHNDEIIEIVRRGRLDSKGAYKTDRRLLLINGKETPIENDDDLRGRVNELMGISLRKFLSLVYVRQGKLTTILEPSKEHMDSVIGITLLRELREQTDDTKKNLEKYESRDAFTEAETLEKRFIPQLTSDLGLLKADATSLELEVESLNDLVKRAESPELIELLSQIQEIESIQKNIHELDVKIHELLTNYKVSSQDELQPTIERLNRYLTKLQAAKENAAKEAEDLLLLWSRDKGKADAIESEIGEHKTLLQLNTAKCPTCGQDLNARILERILEENAAELDMLRSNEAQNKSKYEEKKRQLEQFNEKITTLEGDARTLDLIRETIKKYANVRDELYASQAKLSLKTQTALGKLGLLLQHDDPELKVKVAQKLPVQPEELANKKMELENKLATLVEKTKRMKSLDEELKRSQELLTRLRRRIDRANLARNLSIAFDQAVEARRREFLKYVEFKALEYYKTMTDQHVYAAIKIDPEEYTVWVEPIGLTEAVPANRVGGGHQTLLALSVRLALLDSLGFHSLLILDEPTYGVDSDNLPQLASQIGEASRQLSQMILVTHYNICEEEASNIIDVTVQEDGISRAGVRL